MASIFLLGTEILVDILQYVDDESPWTTKKSVVLVNKHFNDTAQLVTHRRKTLTYGRKLEETQEQIQTWLNNPFLLRNIRQLTLTGHLDRSLKTRGRPEPGPADHTLTWAPLVEFVTKAARLIKVSFDFYSADFPLALLEALQTYHPQVKLYIWRYHRDEELDHTDAAEKALAVSPILRAIKANVWKSGRRTDIDLRIAAFQRIVANAPNLELASISQGSSGCVVHYQMLEDQAREQKAAAKFFSHTHEPNPTVRKLVLDGFSLSKATLIEWGKYVSLSHLEDLKCSRGLPYRTYFEAAPALLTNLKHLSLNLSSASDHPGIAPLVERYLATCAPLETLSLWSWMGVVSVDTILKHGATLKRLELHERECDMLGSRRGLLSTEDVRRIRKECPRLEALTLDMDREDADWQKDLDHHKEMLQEIAQFGERLRRLQIYLDLGVANRTAGVHGAAPSLQAQDTDSSATGTQGLDAADVSAEQLYQGPFYPPSRVEMQEHGEQLWKIIFGEPTHTGPRELDIKWGEWERKRTGGLPADWVLWEQANMRYVVVRPEERDDRPGQAMARVFGEGVGCERSKGE